MTKSGATGSCRRTRRRRNLFDLWSPRRSIRDDVARHTDTAIASPTIRRYARSRCSFVRTLESLTPSRSNGSGRITAAATRGPASAPRPASSAPAIRVNPWARSRRSYLSRSRSVKATRSPPGGEVCPPREPAEPRGGPDDDEGLAHHLVHRNEAQPEPRVVGVGPVVPQHE